MTDHTELNTLLEAIKLVYGYDFTDYAKASVARRVDHYMTVNKIPGLPHLSKVLLKDEREFAHFIQEFTVNVTEMFRDPSFFNSLREKVLKRLATYPFIKIWVAGCSTGEEVYSLAVMLKEEGLLHRSVIYATDINQKALQIARDGIYHLNLMKKYTGGYQKAGGKYSFSDYYMAKYDSAIIDRSLRQNIVFSIHNLANDTSFNEFQLIICRNVLIYFNQALQNRAINLFYDSLCQFGLLALGSKESLLFSDKRNCFGDVDRREKIFIKEK
ncbi:MAG TPA: protein-glutamate O-methyltransferase CheR [Sphingobacteriaceae bacterium]